MTPIKDWPPSTFLLGFCVGMGWQTSLRVLEARGFAGPWWAWVAFCGLTLILGVEIWLRWRWRGDER